jgi:glycosyltransferase involved in cell wall biosynthesis
MRYSVIIPVYNRPDEVDELLQSLTMQHFKDFEVVVVEDGSSIPCKEVVDRYADRLNIKYFSKLNSGPGQTRNYGTERSEGEYLIILDSDVILPEGYFDAVEKELLASPADAFGGPDRAHDSFTDIQKAINYSMTSFFTTGGIRGGKKKIANSIPAVLIWEFAGQCIGFRRIFKDAFWRGYIDFSIRIFKNGYTCRLFPGCLGVSQTSY